LKLAGSGTAARVYLTALVDPDLGKTDDDPTKQTQYVGGVSLANSAVIFTQRYIEGMMQAAFDYPIAALEFEEACRIEFFQGETANEINDLGGLLSLAPDPSSEPRDGLDSGKAYPLRCDLLAIQHSDLVSSPIVLPAQSVGARRGLRGKKTVP
jgi:hypothetical protein